MPTTVKLVYQVRGQLASVRRDQALSGPFSILAKDLKAISEGDTSR
jgi:hypothetical protein